MTVQVIGLLGLLDLILNRDGYIIFICGKKESGKTNIGLLLAEYSFHMGYRTKLASNIHVKSVDYSIRQIIYLDVLEEWLKTSGRKTFILDEAGRHLGKMDFMTKKSKRIIGVAQLIRHYDAGLIGIAPSEAFINNNFLNTDILDAKIRKISKKKAIVFDYLHGDSYILYDIPETSFYYNPKGDAPFFMKKPPDLTKMGECCRVAYMYGIEKMSYDDIAKTYDPPKSRSHVANKMREHLKHIADSTKYKSTVEDKNG